MRDALIHRVSTVSRLLAYVMLGAVFLYLINNYLVFWQELPGPYILFSHFGWFDETYAGTLSGDQVFQGWVQVLVYLVILVTLAVYALRRQQLSLRVESKRFEILAAYLVRAAFWAVLLIGLVDMLISFLRVERMLEAWVGKELVTELGRPSFRGTFVHYPLLLVAFGVAFLAKKISFSWLALLVVLAEFTIVITRFVFSYEQAFMGDLVRFWYAALFLFASAYTLVHEGHVRVDVLYAGFSRAKKAWSNSIGIILFGIPLCWVILMHGMGGRGNSINGPLLSFEISQSGYGMYVKYLMAGFLVVFALTMLIQFVGYLLNSIADLIDPEEPEAEEDHEHHAGDSNIAAMKEQST